MNSKHKIMALKTLWYLKALIAVLFLMVVWVMVLYGANESAPAQTPPPAPSETAPTPTPITTPETITPTYHILPIFKMNDALNVEEEQRWDGTMMLRSEDSNPSNSESSGRTSKTYPFYKQCFHNYVEKINLITDDQLSFKSERYYSLSSIKSNMPDTGQTLTRTSLEEKTLALECKNYQVFSCEKLAPKEATIIKDDYSYVNSFNWIYSLLPDAEITLAVGASYPIKNKELGRIIFREHFNEKSCVISGNGVLEEIDKTTARLLITIKIKQTQTDNTVLTADLIGFCKTSTSLTGQVGQVNSEPVLDLEISGPFNITQPAFTSEEKKLSPSVDGVLKIKSKITLKK